MKKLLPSFVMGVALCATLCAFSQPASAQTGWERVQALPAGTHVHLKLQGRSLDCNVKAADTDSLTCVRDAGAKTEILQKADIKSIKIHHRLRSTLVGAGIGAGILAIVGAATTNNGNGGGFFIFSRGEVAVILAVPGAVIGAIVGVLTDFTQSTVYKA